MRPSFNSHVRQYSRVPIRPPVLDTEHFTSNSSTTMRYIHFLNFALLVIVHFTVVCLVAKPLNRSEAKVDLVMIQTLLLFKCK